jgi:RHS repeat-associated protein
MPHDHSHFAVADQSPKSGTGLLDAFKAAKREVSAAVKRTGPKAALLAMIAAATVLCLPDKALAQDAYAKSAYGTGSAVALNNTGEAAGVSQNLSASFTVTAPPVTLPTLGGSSQNQALGINDSGVIVGKSSTSAGSVHAFRYSSGVLTDLGTLPNCNNQQPATFTAVATGINSSGQIVGYTSYAAQSGCPALPSQAFVDTNGTMTRLAVGGVSSAAYAIDDSGQVVGQFVLSGTGPQHAFLYSNGVTTDLGTLGGTNSIAFGINNNGQVVGEAMNASGNYHAFLYSGGTMSDLGTLGGATSNAFGINNSGQIVGQSLTSAGVYDAFVYNSGAMTDLLLSSANGINNAGQIVANDGFGSTYLLSPASLVPGKTLGAACDVPGGCDAGDPITIGTGNVFERITDYTTVGPNPLALIRYYNSLSYAAAGNTSSSIGANWRTNFDRSLSISANSISAERPDGQIVTFTLSGSNWTSDTDLDFKLVQVGSTWSLTDRNDTVESYNANGQLSTVTARGGYTQTLTYGGSGSLSTVTDSYNRTLTFSPNTSGLIQTVTTPDNQISFAYTTIGANGSAVGLTSVTYQGSTPTTQTYVYENQFYPLALTGIIDENNNRYATWTYDTLGRGKTSQHGTNADLTTFTYNGDGSTTVTNAFGVADTYKFAKLQGSQKVTEIDRAATSTTLAATRTFGYDSNGFLNSETDWNGNKTTYVNNAQGNPTTINEAVGSSVARTTTISYDPTFIRLPHQIITPGLTSTFAYDGSGNALTRTDLDTTTNSVPYSTNGQSRVTTWTWSTTGQELSEQLPRTDVTAKTTFTFDGTGALTQVSDAVGHLTRVTVHMGGGEPITVLDANNVTDNLRYDGRQRLHTNTLSTSAGSLVTTWTYDPAGNLQSLQLPDNSKLTYGYDTAHRLTSITDLLSNSINYTLNALGDKTLIQIKNPSGTVEQSHSGTFDALGRALTDVGGMSQTTTYTWDKNGNALTIAPPSPSGTTTQTWDALNRLATRVDPSPGGTTTFTYDAHDRPLTVKDANLNTTSYVNDGFGDRTQTVSPDSGTTVFHYDPDRNLTQKVLAGSLTQNSTYDALDRPLATTYPSDTTLNVSRTYDQTTGHGFGVGRLTSATDQAGSLSNTYDERGNVTAESRVVTSLGTLLTVTTFDNASRVSGIGYPSGTLVAYGRDTTGQVTSITAKPPGGTVTNVATSITYEPFGPETGLTFGNGVTGTYGYDADYRPTSRADKNGTTSITNIAYGYFTNNSVHTITDSVSAANTQTLGYDTLDRLTSAVSGTGGYGTFGWTWDAVSNVKTQVVNGTTTTYNLTAGTNKFATIVSGSTTETVNSTAAGNINTIKVGTTTLDTLTYNQANELASAATTSSSATYKYDLQGQRLEKAPPGVNPILYQYGQAAKELLSENDLHSGQTADYIYLNGRPIGEVNPTNGKLYYTHTDNLGTPQKLTDSTKAVVWSATYQPFGGTVSFSGTLTNQNLRLPGQYFDAETTMNHNGFRDYAAGLTRYVESDPIGLRGGMNTYQYVKGNPYKFTDRSGLVGCPSNTVLVCVADAPEIPRDTSLPKSVYQPKYNFGGVGYGPADPANPNSGDTKWMRYNCNFSNGGTCSFVAPGVGYDGHGVETRLWGSESVPVNPAPFVVDPAHPTGDVDEPFLKALKKNYQCMPTGKPKP